MRNIRRSQGAFEYMTSQGKLRFPPRVAATLPSARKSQGAFEYILLLGGILLIVVVAVIIMRNSVLNQANQQVEGNVNVWKFQTCIPMYLKDSSTVIAHWGFDESSGTTAKEEKAGRDGTLYSFAFDGTDGWAPGHNGNGLKFDGSGDYVTAPLPIGELQSSNQVTITAWIKTTSDLEQFVMIQNGPLQLGTTGGKAYGSIYTADWTPIDGTSKVSTGEWVHLAETYDGSSIKLYVNGRLEANVGKSGDFGGASTVYIGRFSDQNIWQFNGIIDDLVIYSRALTQDEIC